MGIGIIRWKHPRPAEHITRTNRLDPDGVPTEIIRRFQHHFTFLNQVKPVGNVTFTKDEFARWYHHGHRVRRQKLDLIGFESPQAWMSGKGGRQR